MTSQPLSMPKYSPQTQAAPLRHIREGPSLKAVPDPCLLPAKLPSGPPLLRLASGTPSSFQSLGNEAMFPPLCSL